METENLDHCVKNVKVSQRHTIIVVETKFITGKNVTHAYESHNLQPLQLLHGREQDIKKIVTAKCAALQHNIHIN